MTKIESAGVGSIIKYVEQLPLTIEQFLKLDAFIKDMLQIPNDIDILELSTNSTDGIAIIKTLQRVPDQVIIGQIEKMSIYV